MLLVVVVLAATLGLLHAEALFGGRIYHADDVGEGYWPSRVAILRALASGEIPDWEPRAWGGYPLVAVPNYGTFYPPNALFLVLGAARGVAWSVVAHQLAGGIAMLALLRKRGLILPAAAFGAVAYALGTFSVERIRHLAFEQSIAWIPILLIGLDDILGGRVRRGILVAGLALGFVCLAGALPLVPFVCALALAYVVPRAGRSVRVWGAIVASLGLAGCVGAAQLVPTLWHLSLSPRHAGVSYEFASRYAWPDLRWIVTFLAPDVWGVPHLGRYFGPPTHWELAGYYPGALAVALAFLAPVIRKRELAALAALSLLAIGLALGDAGPIHPVLFRFVPGYRSLRCPARALFVLVVTVPVLAAEGIHRLRGARLSERALRGSLAALFAAGLLLLAVRASPSSGGLPMERQVATSHLVLQMVALCGCGALLAAGVAYARVAWAVTALLAIDLFTVGRSYLEPWSAESPMALARAPAVRRMLAVVGDDRAAFGQGVSIGANNLGLAADFRSIGGYDPFPVWRWVELLWIASRGRPYPHTLLTEDVGVGHLDSFESPLVDALNVRWLVSTEEPGAGWIRARRRCAPGAARAAPLREPRSHAPRVPRSPGAGGTGRRIAGAARGADRPTPRGRARRRAVSEPDGRRGASLARAGRLADPDPPRDRDVRSGRRGAGGQRDDVPGLARADRRSAGAASLRRLRDARGRRSARPAPRRDVVRTALGPNRRGPDARRPRAGRGDRRAVPRPPFPAFAGAQSQLNQRAQSSMGERRAAKPQSRQEKRGEGDHRKGRKAARRERGGTGRAEGRKVFGILRAASSLLPSERRVPSDFVERRAGTPEHLPIFRPSCDPLLLSSPGGFAALPAPPLSLLAALRRGGSPSPLRGSWSPL